MWLFQGSDITTWMNSCHFTDCPVKNDMESDKNKIMCKGRKVKCILKGYPMEIEKYSDYRLKKRCIV